MISNHISDILIAAKSMPNSMERNKLVSHLNDAYFVAYYIEQRDTERLKTANVLNVDMNSINKTAGCICPDGARDRNCQVHSVFSA